eukprot:11215323-Lingulodinium_polyedra.AAC.1
MVRRFRQRLQAYYDPDLGPDSGDERQLLCCVGWEVDASCIFARCPEWLAAGGPCNRIQGRS